MMAWGNVNLSKGLMEASSVFNDVVPVSLRIDGDSKVRVGFNVGALYDINEKVSIGASYRSRIMMKVTEGTASLDYASEAIKQIISGSVPPLDNATFRSELPLPSNLTVGASYRPIKPLELALDVQMIGWKAYNTLDIEFNEKALTPYNQSLEKNYKHVFAIRAGAQYATTDRLDLRAGIYYDQSPVDENYFNPETPSMDKLGFSIGASFRPFNGFSIDFSALYIAGISRDGRYSPVVLGSGANFEGRYSTTAFCPTLGVSYNF